MPLDRPALVVPFTKMNGAGNDFIVLDNRFLRFGDDELQALARTLCPRRTGVGADGLLALDEHPEADFRMRYRNADGSLGTMCGNGARCLARFAARAGLGTEVKGTVTLAFETDGGPYRAAVAGRAASGPVSLDVPPPQDHGPAGVEGRDDVVRIWTGTEHAVLFTDDLDAADVTGEGEGLRHDPAFAPTGTNVDFVEVGGVDAEGTGRVRVRTFEKGVEAETLACGTGAVASALVARLSGRLDADTVAVEMPGGVLTVGFRVEGETVSAVTLAGPAETVYEGTVEWQA